MSMNQYIYIYQDCTIDNSNDHERHLKRQGLNFPSQLLPIPLSSCDWAATQLAKHPPVVGDDSPRQTAHVNYEALD